MSTTVHEPLDPATLSTSQIYRLVTDLVAPRPIAWVSTLDAQGRANLAPFSYFQAVCSAPPTVMLAIGNRPDGRPKDTLANILERRELTISHVSEPLAEAMNATSAAFEPEIDEWERSGGSGAKLASLPSQTVAPPRVAMARAAMECRMVRAIPLGHGRKGGPSTTLVLAEVQLFWVAADLLQRDARGRLRPIDPAGLAAIGRMGGVLYARTRDTFAMERPEPPKPPKVDVPES